VVHETLQFSARANFSLTNDLGRSAEITVPETLSSTLTLFSANSSLPIVITDDYETYPETSSLHSISPSASGKTHVSETNSVENKSILSNSLEDSVSHEFHFSGTNSEENRTVLNESREDCISDEFYVSLLGTESEKKLNETVTITSSDTEIPLNNELIISRRVYIWILCVVVLFLTGTFFLGWSSSLELRFFDMEEKDLAEMSISDSKD
jgi:hypothetical protein